MSALSPEEKLRAVSLSPMTQTVKTDLAYQSKDADFTIISADGISFKVHRVVLSLARSVYADQAGGNTSELTWCSHSPVFRDMLSVPTKAGASALGDSSSTLTLYDSAIENSASLKTFLDFLYLQPVPTVSSLTYRDMVGPLKLIQKYDCAGARRLVVYALRSMLPDPGVQPIYIFLAAAILDDVPTCVRAIKASDKSTYPAVQQTGGSRLSGPYTTEDMFDVRTKPMSMAELIPFKYAFALMRARLVVETDNKRRSAYGSAALSDEKDKYAAEFASLMA
jgi:hypothetical protein